MTQFKKGDEVAWIVKYIKRDTTFATIHDGVSISLETSPGSTVLVHNPQLHPAAALDVNKGWLEAAKAAIAYCEEISIFGSKYGTLEGPIVSAAFRIARGLNEAIAAAEKGE